MRRGLVLSLLLVAGCPASRARPAAPATPSPAARPGDDLGHDGIEPAAGGDTTPGDHRLADGGPRQVVDLDVIHMDVVGTEGGEPSIEASRPGPLLDQGNDEFGAGRYPAAITWYRKLVTDFPDSALAPAALYNVALAQERQDDVDAAVATYLELGRTFPTAAESLEGLLRAAALQAEHRRWGDAVATLDQVLARDDLSREVRLEAQARKGYAQLELDHLDEAEATLAQAVATWRRANRIEDPYYVAMAHFYLGEIDLRRFQTSPLRSADDQLAADMEAKRLLVMSAYGHWKDALGHHQAYWATAAGYQMSQIFYEYWKVGVRAPYPDGLDPAGRHDYVVEVHARLRENLTKALEGHQANVELAGAYGVTTSWSDGSKIRATEILGVLDREARGELVSP
ncbi:MAG: tetratricopeptide repeat protein [Kofleriaceae bacterium]|nr:tetratricopeptide repeat protein [Kofleriaceae bacterium]